MEWEQVLSELVEFVKTSTPQLWAIYRRQLIVTAIQSVLWIAILAPVAVKFQDKAKNAYALYKKDSSKNYMSDLESGLWGLLYIVCVGVAVALLCGIFGRIINPDYYIIRGMIETLK